MTTPIAPSPAVGNVDHVRRGRESEPSDRNAGRTAPASEPVNERDVAAAVESTPPELIAEGRTVEVSFNDEVKRVVITVKSEDDGEIVRQIPQEEYLRFLARFKDMIGVLFDETA